MLLSVATSQVLHVGRHEASIGCTTVACGGA